MSEQILNSQNKVAVTGAGGSLGQALIKELLSEGFFVKALVRNEQSTKQVKLLGAVPMFGDIRDDQSLKELCKDVNVVYHLAAWIGKPNKPKLASEVNAKGTRKLMKAASTAGVKRIVLASSIAVYGPVTKGLISEDRNYWTVGEPYGDSKVAAEKFAKSLAKEKGIELVILRPTMIYGPKSPSWTLVPFDIVKKGLPMIMGSGEDKLDAVYIDDVAKAFALAGQVPEAAGETFNIGGLEVDWNTFLGYYANMSGKKLRRLPLWLVKGGAKTVATLTNPIRKHPLVVPEMIGAMTSQASYDSSKAKNILGFEAKTSLKEGMQKTETWLREEGLLKRGSVALVTGAASGLGKATVEKLLAKGVTVYAADINVEALSSLEGAHPLELDVTSQESINRALETINKNGHTINLLINVAGILKAGALEAQDTSDIEKQFAVNAFGPLKLIRAISPQMRSSGWGRIINVTSTNGFLVTPFMGAYSASKYALEALSDSLRLELKPFGIEVVVIQPGAMKTPFAEQTRAGLRENAKNSNDEWSEYLSNFADSNLWGEATATKPEKVAGRIAKIALAKRVRPRYYGTFDAVPARFMALMPDVVKDFYFTRVAGLSKKGR